MPTDLPPRRSEEPAPETNRWRGLHLAFLVISLLVLGSLAAMVLVDPQGGRGRPLKVAIFTPTLETSSLLDARETELVAEAVVESALRALAARDGLYVERSEATPAEAKEAAQLASEQGADEALVFTVECQDRGCRASIRRLRAVDASLQWRRSFKIETAPLIAIDHKLGNELHIAYLKFDRRPDGARLFCPQDRYRKYLGIVADVKRKRLSPGQAIRALQTIREQAPRFFDVYLQEAKLRSRLKAHAEHQAAIELLLEARRIAPGDWRAPLLLVPQLLMKEQLSQAAEEIERLRLLLPGDPRIESWHQHAEQPKNDL